MISGIKRMFGGSEEEGHTFEKRVHREPVAVEPPSGQMEDLPSTERRGYFVPYDADVVQRQLDMVRAAIAQGGRFGDHEIPVPWLRMMLAGLEGRSIDQDAAWEGIAAPPRKDPVEESPTYQELFSRRP